MHDTDEKQKVAVDPRREADWADLCDDPDNLEWLVGTVWMSGNLEALIAFACEDALANDQSPEGDPDRVRHPGARAAIEAYAAWKQAEGRDVPIDLLRPDPESNREPEILPMSLVGKWVAWSSDGMKILASAATSEEAESVAIDAGEPEPILQYHSGSRYRYY
jgi:hypothetical protein